MPHSVAIVQRIISHYRVSFFEQLKKKLNENEISIELIYGQNNKRDLFVNNDPGLEWATRINNIYLPFGIVYQPCLQKLKNADLVIVEQANRLVLNFLLMLKMVLSKQKLAFWGHGINLQIGHESIINKFKKKYSGRVDWWFAYTKKTGNILSEMGIPGNKVSIVQNSIDTEEIKKIMTNVTSEELDRLKSELGLGNSLTGIYCGGLYRAKKISFLLETCDQIKEKIPNFHMLILGDGADSSIVREASSVKPWIHFFGPTFDREKIKLFMVSDICIYPGILGLGILETFALQTPIVTIEQNHSPEIEYLDPAVNGLITPGSISDFSSACINLLLDKALRIKLQDGCKQSAKLYTIDNMVRNFAGGIISCLEN